MNEATTILTRAVCDDHEITDDFLFDSSWIAALADENATDGKNSPLTRFIVGNALHAFGAFQGVGNDPKGFFDEFKIACAGQLPASKLLKIDWSFVLDTYPPTLFLDARTQRYLPENSIEVKFPFATNILYHKRDVGSMSRAMTHGDLTYFKRDIPFNLRMFSDRKLSLLLNSIAHEGTIILVTGSPIVCNERVERTKGFVPFRDAKENDSELWISNPSNYLQLVQTLMDKKVETCICFGGDVHHGYLRSATVSRVFNNLGKEGVNEEVQRISLQQVVSSPLLNRFETDFAASGSVINNAAIEIIIPNAFSENEMTTKRYSFNNSKSAWEIVEEGVEYSDKDAEYVFEELIIDGIPGLHVDTRNPVTSNHFVEIDIQADEVFSVAFDIAQDQAPKGTPKRSPREFNFKGT